MNLNPAERRIIIEALLRFDGGMVSHEIGPRATAEYIIQLLRKLNEGERGDDTQEKNDGPSTV